MANYYWVGGTGNLDGSSPTHWSLTDGGTGGAGNPQISDSMFFTSLSGGGVITIAAAIGYNNFNTTGFTGTFAGSTQYAFTSSGTGALILTPNMFPSGVVNLTFSSGASTTITSAGNVFYNIYANSGIGSIGLLDDTSTVNSFTLLGNFNFTTNGHNISCASISIGTGTSSRTVNLSNSIINVKPVSSGTQVSLLSPTGLTYNTTNTIVNAYQTASASYGVSIAPVPAASISLNFITSSGYTGGILLGSFSTTFLNATCVNTVSNITFTFPTGYAWTITNNFNFIGTASYTITLKALSTTNISFVSAAGTINCNYCAINYITASGGTTWHGGLNSTNISSLGWVWNTLTGTSTRRKVFFGI